MNFGNSVGLRNPGMDAVIPQFKALREKGLRAWLNMSVSADNPEDFATLVKAFDDLADSIELNFSCPHARSGYGASIGMDKAIASEYIRRICEIYPNRKSLLFVKLTPNVDDIGSIAKAVINAGADGISAINTVGPVNHIDPASGLNILNSSKGGKGGISGTPIREITLKAVRDIRAAVGDDVPVIGMGGVSDGRSCADLVAAGADAVGIGSALAHVGQKNWGPFFKAVKTEASAILNGKTVESKSSSMLTKGSLMNYRPYKVVQKKLHSEDTLLVTLDGQMKGFKAGAGASREQTGHSRSPFLSERPPRGPRWYGWPRPERSNSAGRTPEGSNSRWNPASG